MSVSSQLVWALVKKNNVYLHKGLNGSQFSSEPGNLYNRHSYKYSGLANEKTVDIRAGDDDSSLVISKRRPKNINKPNKAVHSVPTKKHASKINTSIAADLKHYRPDLTKAAVARASAVSKSLRVKKSKK
ncbi:hypothetical protein WJX84_006689 [Apatococcus fuscideae]|uniref:Ribosomal eL28/Mak16 domain-containing protein n=1 Tax=Apatococcus fuscideae TaxID=2026836 RepID=A0AAW1T2Q6_9CHLO